MLHVVFGLMCLVNYWTLPEVSAPETTSAVPVVSVLSPESGATSPETVVSVSVVGIGFAISSFMAQPPSFIIGHPPSWFPIIFPIIHPHFPPHPHFPYIHPCISPADIPNFTPKKKIARSTATPTIILPKEAKNPPFLQQLCAQQQEQVVGVVCSVIKYKKRIKYSVP